MALRPTHQATTFPGIVPSDLKCSICLEDIVDDNQKGISKLQCGHFFHLACIGVAFNAKGAMICPNCREVEDSEWMYSQINFAHNQPTLDGQEGIPTENNRHVMHQSIYDLFSFYNGDSHNMFESLQATNGNLLEDHVMLVRSMFGAFPYNMASEVTSFDFGGDGSSNGPTPPVHSRPNTYVGLYITENGSIGYRANPSSMNTFNDLDNNGWLVQNLNSFGTITESPGVGTSSSSGGMSNPLNIRSYLNIQPSLDLPSSSTASNMGQWLLYNREPNTYSPEVLYHGSSSSAASVDPTELGLNMSISGGSLYGN